MVYQIGSGAGDFAINIAHAYPLKAVIGFEIVPALTEYAITSLGKINKKINEGSNLYPLLSPVIFLDINVMFMRSFDPATHIHGFFGCYELLLHCAVMAAISESVEYFSIVIPDTAGLFSSGLVKDHEALSKQKIPHCQVSFPTLLRLHPFS